MGMRRTVRTTHHPSFRVHFRSSVRFRAQVSAFSSRNPSFMEIHIENSRIRRPILAKSAHLSSDVLTSRSSQTCRLKMFGNIHRDVDTGESATPLTATFRPDLNRARIAASCGRSQKFRLHDLLHL